MNTEKSLEERLANAQAEDYKELFPEEPICQGNTCYHIFGGIIIGLSIAGIVTLGFVVFT